MSTKQIKSGIHRFRVRRPSSPAPRRRSASPPAMATATAVPTPMPDPSASSSSALAAAVTAGSGSGSGPGPGPGSGPRDMPACDRCRSFKKKCSRTFPTCTLCANAGQRCSFSTSASSSEAQAHHLRARVEWLTRIVNQNLPVGAPGIESFGTGTDVPILGPIGAMSAPPSVGTSPAMQLELSARTPGSGATPGSIVISGGFEPGSDPAGMPVTADPLSSVSLSAGATGNAIRTLSEEALARRLVDAYFRHIHRAYPFMNKAQVLRELEHSGDSAWPRRSSDSTLLFLVMVLGCTTLQRSGQMSSEVSSKFDVPSAEIVQECLLREDLESIQILVLLALYSLFDPAATSTWSIAGIAARKAMSFGLSRRASEDKTLSATEVEFRHRLFWSTWVLDRVMSISRGLPPALSDDNIDVPLPGLTVEEFASPDRQHFASVLQTHRHVIHLRQLEDRILKQIHTRRQAEVAALSQTDRQAIVREIRIDIENWYSQGCLLSPLEADNVPIHSSVAWLSARYYQLLFFLHYPCQFNSFGSMVPAVELLRFAQKHLQSTMVLLQQRQLPLNRVTLCRIFPVGLVLMHCFISCTECTPFLALEELDSVIRVLEAFPETWSHARQGCQLFRQFRSTVSGLSGQTPLPYGDAGFGPAAAGGSKAALLRPVMNGMASLMQEVLGKTTFYFFHEFLGGRGTMDHTGHSPTGPLQSSMAMMNDDGTIEDGWGSLEFGFM